MENRWNAQFAKDFKDDPKNLRIYTSRLLGQEPQLVLHGGGNTSVKVASQDFFGEQVHTLFVKGSGWDLATIEEAGFAPLRLEVLLRLAQLKTLSDSDMVEQQRLAMLDSKAPNASVEAILHAIIPFQYVDHTHANAVLAITNTANGLERIQKLYGDRVIVIPYVMPGFALAKLVYERTKDIDWEDYEGMILMNHGIFTFSNDGRESYDRMVQLVSEAEHYLNENGATNGVTGQGTCNLLEFARLRQQVSLQRGIPIVAKIDPSPEAVGFSNQANVETIGTRGPLTPDHSIFAKRIPVVLSEHTANSIESYGSEYKSYFQRNTNGELTCLDPAPRWAIWPGRGLVSFGLNPKNASVIGDIARHTTRVIQISESLGGWSPLSERDVFDVEYWELEQAKLKSGKAKPALQGKIALIALSDASLSKQCETVLSQADAAVTVVDRKTSEYDIGSEIDRAVLLFGGLDLLVTDIDIDSPYGISDELLSAAVPFLNLGIEPKIVAIATSLSPKSYEAQRSLVDHLRESSCKKIQVNIVISESGEVTFASMGTRPDLEPYHLIERIASL